MRIGRPNFVACLLACAGALIVQLGVNAVCQPRQAVAASFQVSSPPSEIAKQQATLAREALRTMGEYSGTAGLWHQRLIQSLRNGGGDKSELIDALKHYVETAQLHLKKVEGFSKNMSIGPKLRGGLVFDARYQVLEAERWLAEEEAR